MGLLQKPSFLFAGTLLFRKKTLQSAAQAVFRNVWETPKLSYKHEIYVDRFFGDRFVDKEAGLST